MLRASLLLLSCVLAAVVAGVAGVAGAAGAAAAAGAAGGFADDPAAPARALSRQLARQGTWSAADLQALLALQLADPERFAADAGFRARVLEVLPRSLDPSAPPRLRDELLAELNQVRGIGFAESEAIEAAWGAVPRRALERRIPFPAAGARGPGSRLRFADEPEAPLVASVYSLPSFFFGVEEAQAFLAGVRRAAPDRELIVLTDLPLRRRQAQSGLKLRLLETYGRPYSPWPRDPFSLARGPAGEVRVVVRPNLQAGREEDAALGLELVQNLPEDLDRAWGGVAWMEAPVPFHNGQILVTRDAAWITLHALEPQILAALRLERVPVETFSSPAGVERYVAAARRAAGELSQLYGRPVRFAHPLPAPGAASGPALMRRLGGGAGHDLDSLLTLLPAAGGLAALVADLDAGRGLLQALQPADWEALRDVYGLEPSGAELVRAVNAAQSTPGAAALDGFLDLVAEHLESAGVKVRRLPLLRLPVVLLRERQGLSHEELLLTWNNVVAETRQGRVRAEGFASRLPTADRRARDAFAALGAELDLVPPLVRSIVLNGGYRCASNHVRGQPAAGR